MTKIKNHKIAIAIGTLSVITLMAIIYAAFTGQLTINGTADVRDSKWDIHIVESGQLEQSNTLSTSAKVLTKPTASPTSISDFALSLTTPGDTIEYTFHVINDGDYDAKISTLTKNGPTCTANGSTTDPEAVKVCNKLEYTLKYDNGSDVAEEDTILSKETKTMKLTVKYQEFDDPSLLPTTNVSISGLGITLQYAQKGSAKVNEDGTTPYDPYRIGMVYTLGENNDEYYVIGNEKDYVTLLKANPLTVDEISNYGTGYINKYSGLYNNSVYSIGDSNNSGGIVYYSSATCGYPLNANVVKGNMCPNNSESAYVTTGCTSSYDTSDIKNIVDTWANSTFINNELAIDTNGYRARLLNESDLLNNGFIKKSSGDYDAGDNTLKIFNVKDYYYWTMIPTKKKYTVYVVSSYAVVDSTGGSGCRYGDAYMYSTTSIFARFNAIRPVINVYKSAIQNNS